MQEKKTIAIRDSIKDPKLTRKKVPLLRFNKAEKSEVFALLIKSTDN